MPLTEIVLPPDVVITTEQFFAICQRNPDWRLELIDQEIILMSPASPGADRSNLSFAARLWLWAEQDGSGLAFGPTAGFEIAPRQVLSPDTAWVSRAAWEALSETEQERGFPALVPDFVAELRSPSDSLAALQRKMQRYQKAGVALGWLLDRPNRDVYVYRPERETVYFSQPSTLSGEPVLPGFELDLATIW